MPMTAMAKEVYPRETNNRWFTVVQTYREKSTFYLDTMVMRNNALHRITSRILNIGESALDRGCS